MELALLIAFILGLLVLFKTQTVTKATLVADKDFLDAISKTATLGTVLIGGILAYVRFFKGRLLSPKINLSIKTGQIPAQSSNLHWVEVEIKNVGSISIWNYDLHITARLHGDVEASEKVTDFVSWDEGEIRERNVDIAESVFEHGFLSVPLSFKAVTFQVAITLPSGAMWTRCATVENAHKPHSNLVSS